MAFSKALILNLTVLFFVAAYINLDFNGANAQESEKKCGQNNPCSEGECCVSDGKFPPKIQCKPLAEDGKSCAKRKLNSGNYLYNCPCKDGFECQGNFTRQKCKAAATNSTN